MLKICLLIFIIKIIYSDTFHSSVVQFNNNKTVSITSIPKIKNSNALLCLQSLQMNATHSFSLVKQIETGYLSDTLKINATLNNLYENQTLVYKMQIKILIFSELINFQSFDVKLTKDNNYQSLFPKIIKNISNSLFSYFILGYSNSSEVNTLKKYPIKQKNAVIVFIGNVSDNYWIQVNFIIYKLGVKTCQNYFFQYLSQNFYRSQIPIQVISKSKKYLMNQLALPIDLEYMVGITKIFPKKPYETFFHYNHTTFVLNRSDDSHNIEYSVIGINTNCLYYKQFQQIYDENLKDIFILLLSVFICLVVGVIIYFLVQKQLKLKRIQSYMKKSIIKDEFAYKKTEQIIEPQIDLQTNANTQRQLSVKFSTITDPNGEKINV